MKLFNPKPTWNQLVQERANSSGISSDFVRMNQVNVLENMLLKIKTMAALKPNPDFTTAIDVLTTYKSQISKIVDESMNQSFSDSEGASFNRRP